MAKYAYPALDGALGAIRNLRVPVAPVRQCNGFGGIQHDAD